MAGRNKEPLPLRLLQLHSLNMRQRKIPNINPQTRSGGRDLLLVLACDEVPKALVRSIQGGQAVEVVHDGPEHHGRVHGRQGEVGLLILDEVPSRSLGERLGGTVSIRRVEIRLLFCDGVPVRLRVRMPDPVSLLTIHEGREGAGDHDALDTRCVLLDGLQHTRRANDRRVQQVLLGVLDVEVEGRRRVDHGLEPVDLHGIVERTQLRDVRHDAEVEQRGGRVRVCLSDLLRLVFGAHCRHDGVAACQQDVEDVGCDEAAAACFVRLVRSNSEQ